MSGLFGICQENTDCPNIGRILTRRARTQFAFVVACSPSATLYVPRSQLPPTRHLMFQHPLKRSCHTAECAMCNLVSWRAQVENSGCLPLPKESFSHNIDKTVKMVNSKR